MRAGADKDPPVGFEREGVVLVFSVFPAADVDEDEALAAELELLLPAELLGDLLSFCPP